jgi:tripeptide aminopeptidase
LRSNRTSALERFLKYVAINTQAAEGSTSRPSTPGQLLLLEMLANELLEIGAADVTITPGGHLTATIPPTTDKPRVPTVGFIAHVDTSPEVSGENVRPIVHEGYDGRDIVLPDDPSMVLKLADNPDLQSQLGHDIVTASGRTLLGADDKAGVAEIMAAAEYLLAHPDVKHGRLRLAFTSDEEIGRGIESFDVRAFDAYCAYTLDGGTAGELESESFSADALTVTFRGFNTHPGYAKGKMVNALRVAAMFVASLPSDHLSPETTDDYEGYVHPYVIEGGVDATKVRVLLRDFRTAALSEQRHMIEEKARHAAAGVPGAIVEFRLEEYYRNMREVLEQYPEILENAREAIRRAGLEPTAKPIRGGTDGSRLSFVGLPTPNLFAGQHNFHSRLEWVSAQDMDNAVEVIVNLCRVFHERA